MTFADVLAQHGTLVTVALVLLIACAVVWLILTLAGRR